jgi:hypothetical protein
MCENGFLKFDLQRLESLWKEVPKEKEKQATTTNGTKQRWNEFQEDERDGRFKDVEGQRGMIKI